MKKNLKKTLCVVLSMLMMFTFLGVISFAEDSDVTPIVSNPIDFSEIITVLKTMIASIDWSSVLAAAKTVFTVLTNLFTNISAT